MQIFGKRDRKKRKEPPSEATSNNNNDESDEIVLALLREDRPAKWNAKQRRLVKRYRDRQQDGDTSTLGGESAAVAADEAVSVLLVSAKPVDSGDQVLGHAEDDDDCAAESSESNTQEERDSGGQQGDISEIGVKSNHVGEQKPFEARSKQNKGTESVSDEEADAKDTSGQPDSGKSVENKHDDANDHHACNPDNAQKVAQQKVEHEASGPAFTIDEDLQAMLDQLNSKQRRKLVRSLERKEMDVKAVRSEAKSLLGLDVDEKTATSDVAEPPKKKRKRGNNTDVSQLPAEERLRREEQRRLQKEAAEAQVNGGGTVGGGTQKHKHPLNSERRRANRRKPKWESRRPANNEHNSSGFHMRKITSSGS